jgi:hypothetical protein
MGQGLISTKWNGFCLFLIILLQLDKGWLRL